MCQCSSFRKELRSWFLLTSHAAGCGRIRRGGPDHSRVLPIREKIAAVVRVRLQEYIVKIPVLSVMEEIVEVLLGATIQATIAEVVQHFHEHVEHTVASTVPQIKVNMAEVLQPRLQERINKAFFVPQIKRNISEMFEL